MATCKTDVVTGSQAGNGQQSPPPPPLPSPLPQCDRQGQGPRHPSHQRLRVRVSRGGGVAQLVERRTQKSKDPKFEPRQEHKKTLGVFSSQNVVLTRRCVQPPVFIRAHKNAHVRTLKIPCSTCQSSVDYGNAKRPSMHLQDWVALLLRQLQPYPRKVARISRKG